MTMSQATMSFLDALEKSDLAAPELVATALERSGLDRNAPSDLLAKAFVEQRIVTRFQADRLLGGRYRGFFLDEFTILDVLGAGGMGWVYVAEHRESHNRYALKCLSGEFAEDAGMLARLKLEARAGMRLKHANIARTFKFGEAAGTHYVVMELVDGVNLKELVLQQGPVPWAQACDFIVQAASALEYAHEAGMIHRDVKPENFLVRHDGTIKMLDFGLALLGELDEDEFSLAMIFGQDCLGSADYMAPEQSLDSSTVDTRADLYSLGCTLYSILTGVLPFSVRTIAEKLEAHRTKDPVPVRLRRPDVPKEIAEIVGKLMSKDPKDRYQTAGEVRAALAPFARREQVIFDKERILATRAQDAAERVARAKRRRTGASSTTANRGSETAPLLRRQTAIETGVARDTQAEFQPTESTEISLGDPFESRKAAARARAAEPHVSHKLAATEAARGRLVPLAPGSAPIPLTQDSICIGRSGDADIIIAVPQVSGKHCRLSFEDDCWRVLDLQSTNGIRVNGKPVTQSTLWPGDLLTIAEQDEFRIEYQTPRAAEHERNSSLVKVLVVLLSLLAAGGAALWWFAFR